MENETSRYGVTNVNSWRNPREVIITDKYVGLRLTDDECGGLSCVSCRSRVVEVKRAIETNAAPYWWQKHSGCIWIILEYPVGKDPIEFLGDIAQLSFKKLKFLRTGKKAGSVFIKPDRSLAIQIPV